MKIFIPYMYKKNIFDINYDKLKKDGIKCLIYDLDNTIALLDENKIPDEVFKLFKKLKNDFEITIISNNVKSRIEEFCKPFNTKFISFALKPLPFGFIKIRKIYKLKHKEMVIIGDQLMTDVLGGNMYGCRSILVDPLGKKDLKVTVINRFFERRIINKLSKKNILKRGKYYE